MIISLSKVLESPAGTLLATMFRGIVAKVMVIPGKFFRGCGLCVLWVLFLVSFLEVLFCSFGV